MGLYKSISIQLKKQQKQQKYKYKFKRALPDSNWDNSNRQLDTLPN
jgi:hypothetical protein